MTREEQKKNFDRERLALSDRIRHDDLLSPSAFKVGAELCSRLSFSSGFADCDQDYLVKRLSLSERTVKMAVKALQLAGHFEVVRPGRRSSNRYRPIFKPREVQNLHLPETPEVQNLHLPEVERGKKRSPQVQNLPVSQVQNLPLSIPLKKDSFPSLSGPAGGEAASAPDGAGGSPRQNLDRLNARLKQRLGEKVFAGWFGPKLAGAEFAPAAVTLFFPTAFHANHVKTQYEAAILEGLRADHPDVDRVTIAVAKAAPARPENPDARWLLEQGVPLVGEAMGYAPHKAGEAIAALMKRCGNDAAGLRRIIADAAARGLSGDQFRDVLQAGTKELLFADQKKLPLPMMTVKPERKAS
jgi:hypothetical protein